MAQQSRRAQQVRIIGGKWKGRKLRFQADADLRPTLGRMRETLFNWLRPEIANMRCLDAFAGSGVLGFEALSQGAEHVVMVEQQLTAARSLQKTAAVLNAQAQVTIVQADARSYLQRAAEPFDLVFIDPPFTQPKLLDQVMSLLIERQLLRRYVYAEGPSAEHLAQIMTNLGLSVHKQARSGAATALLARADEAD